jgi:hypothetical protein
VGPIVVVTAGRAGHCQDGVSLVFSPALNPAIETIEATALGASPPALPLERLRPYLIEAVERGMAKATSP